MKKLLFLLMLAASIRAFGQAAAPELSPGQMLYLPIYSHIWYGDPGGKNKPRMLLLSALISIRNTDPKLPIRVTSAQYFDTAGRKLKQYLAASVMLEALATHELFIPKSDSAGGSGANFLISWESATPVNPPLVQAVHAEILGTRALAFTTTARPIVPR